jgi:hypothetical protein
VKVTHTSTRRAEKGNRILIVIIVAVLIIGSAVALSMLFAFQGWWQVIFR